MSVFLREAWWEVKVEADLGRELEVLMADAARLPPPELDEIPILDREAAALMLDQALTRVARCRGAIDVRIGEGLGLLAVGDQVCRLGYSGVGDYARERLGMAPRTALNMARVAEALRERPLLREAVVSGRVSMRKAEEVLPVARGEDEAAWVERAACDSVRGLRAAVREVRSSLPESEPDPWAHVSYGLDEAQRGTWDEALELAMHTMAGRPSRAQCVEAVAQEYIAAHPGTPEVFVPAGPAGPVPLPVGIGDGYPLPEIPGCPAPGSAPGERERPKAIDAELRRLVAGRENWDALLGHFGLLLQMTGLWKDLGFSSFSRYCTERLNMSGRAVEQRVWLERRLWDLPTLREAMSDGRLSYDKALTVARRARTDDVLDDELAPLIAAAETTTCIGLRQELEKAEAHRAQMCGDHSVRVRLPLAVATLLETAMEAAQNAGEHFRPPGEALAAIGQHFIDTWKGLVRLPPKKRRELFARNNGLCEVPGCSRAAHHLHHIVYRSMGGDNSPENLTAICATHHLRCIHQGRVRVRGRAPDALVWDSGIDAAGVHERHTTHASRPTGPPPPS